MLHIVAPVVEKGPAPTALPSHTEPVDPVTVGVAEQDG